MQQVEREGFLWTAHGKNMSKAADALKSCRLYDLVLSVSRCPDPIGIPIYSTHIPRDVCMSNYGLTIRGTFRDAKQWRMAADCHNYSIVGAPSQAHSQFCHP